MIEIALDWYEVHLAAVVGTRRQIEALRNGNPDKHGYEGSGWELHIEGAAAELALAKVLGRYWNGAINTFKDGGDVGPTLQVRLRTKHYYDLLIRPDDPDEKAFVLVTGTCPEFRVHGWMWGADAKRQEWLQTHGNRPAAYFVPKDALRAISS